MTVKIEVYKNCGGKRVNAEIYDEWENEYGTKQHRYITFCQENTKEELYESVKKAKERQIEYFDKLLKKIEEEL